MIKTGQAVAAAPAPSPRVRIALECQECSKVFRVDPNSSDPHCPKCGSVDFDVL